MEAGHSTAPAVIAASAYQYAAADEQVLKMCESMRGNAAEVTNRTMCRASKRVLVDRVD